jgi:pilus assembly protein CpaE
MARRTGDSGQATVELALLLPVLLVIVMALSSLVLSGRERLRVVRAAGVAARAAAVGDDPHADAAEALGALPGLEPGRLSVEVTIEEDLVTATVTYRRSGSVVRLPGRVFVPGAIVESATSVREAVP